MASAGIPPRCKVCVEPTPGVTLHRVIVCLPTLLVMAVVETTLAWMLLLPERGESGFEGLLALSFMLVPRGR